MLHEVASAKGIKGPVKSNIMLPVRDNGQEVSVYRPDYQRPRYMKYSNIHDDPKRNVKKESRNISKDCNNCPARSGCIRIISPADIQ